MLHKAGRRALLVAGAKRAAAAVTYWVSQVEQARARPVEDKHLQPSLELAMEAEAAAREQEAIARTVLELAEALEEQAAR